MLVRYLFIVAMFVALGQKNDAKPVDLVQVLARDGGHWVLAAAASTCRPPPYDSCVNVTARVLRYRSECIVSNINLTSRLVRNIQFIGKIEDGDVVINSKGPINQYMIKKRNEKKGLHPLVQKEVEWETAINQPLCWRPRSRPRLFHPYRYVVAPVDMTEQALFVVGVRSRKAIPEYETAIFTKGIVERKKVQRMVDVINRKNYEKNEGCREHRVDFPIKNVPHLWFWDFFVYCLPRLHIMCAAGYSLRDMSDPVNHKTPHEVFTNKVSFKNSAETESILVVHD